MNRDDSILAMHHLFHALETGLLDTLIPMGILFCEAAEGLPIRYINEYCAGLLGYESREALLARAGGCCAGLFSPEEDAAALSRAATLLPPDANATRVCRVMTRAGETLSMRVHCHKYRGKDELPMLFCLCMDVSDAVKTEERLRRQAETDGMTGLYNKAQTETLIRERLSRPDGGAGALLLADLDGLKTINDTLGHAQGDRAIHQIAEALRMQFRRTDIVGRVGGDEFMAFLDGADSESALKSTVSSLMKRLSDLRIGEHGEIPLHGSVGVALGTAGKDTFEALYRRADRALYHVKRNGKNDFAIYTPEMEPPLPL